MRGNCVVLELELHAEPPCSSWYVSNAKRELWPFPAQRLTGYHTPRTDSLSPAAEKQAHSHNASRNLWWGSSRVSHESHSTGNDVAWIRGRKTLVLPKMNQTHCEIPQCREVLQTQLMSVGHAKYTQVPLQASEWPLLSTYWWPALTFHLALLASPAVCEIESIVEFQLESAESPWGLA